MDFYPGLIFRFKVLPFLQKRILPLYKDILHSQKNNIHLSLDEAFYLQIFFTFCNSLLKTNFETMNFFEINVNDTMIIWEFIQKIVEFLSPIFFKVHVPANEKEKILSKFSLSLHKQINYLLS